MDNEKDELTTNEERPPKGKCKAIVLFLIHPPAWFIAVWFLFAAAAIAATVVLLISDCRIGLWANVLYFAAAIFLAYSVYCIIRAAPKIKAKIYRALCKNKYMGEMARDYAFRTLIFTLIAFVINTGYVIVNGFSAIRYRSFWYCCMTAYYLALGLLRGGILYFGRKAAKRYAGDAQRLALAKTNMYLGCGIAMLVSETVLIIAVTQIIRDKNHAQTGMIVAIAMAAYTFYKFTLAIINLIKSRRFRDEALHCIRNINLVDALVSMLSLEMTLIAAAEGGGEMTLLNAVTGGAVCLTSAVLGILMIAKGAKKLKKLNNGERK